MPRKGMELIKAPAFAAGTTTSVPLRQRNIVAGYLLVVTLDVTVTAGSGAGTIFPDSNFRLLRRVTLSVNGKDVQSFSGRFLYLYNKLFGEQQWPQTPIASLTAGAKTIKAYFYIPQEMMHSFTPEEFGLPTSLVDNPELRILWGDGDDLAYGTDATSIVINPATAGVVLYELPYIDSARAAAAYQAQEIKTIEVDVTANASPKIDMTQFRQGDEIRCVFIEGLSNGAAGRDHRADDAVITQIRFVVDGTPKIETTAFADLQARNLVEYRLAALETGCVVIDAGEDEKTQKGDLYTVNTSEKPSLELSVAKQAGENKVRVTTVHVRRAA